MPIDVTDTDDYQEELTEARRESKAGEVLLEDGRRGHAADVVRPQLSLDSVRLHRHRRADRPHRRRLHGDRGVRRCRLAAACLRGTAAAVRVRRRPAAGVCAASSSRRGRIASATVTIASPTPSISCRSPRSRAATPCMAWSSRSSGGSSSRRSRGRCLPCGCSPTRGYPFRLDLQIAYELSDEDCASRWRRRTPVPTDAPYGCGAHPYHGGDDDGR